MKFFLDENVNQGMISHLTSIFRPHEFIGVKELHSKGMDDLELFDHVASGGCDVFVTGDLMQLRRPNERDACRDAGLHWIGIHQVHATGYHTIAGPASTLVHALPFIIEKLESTPRPTFFRLKKSERNNTQVFDSAGHL
ncbi:hypothetical protein C7T36_18590 [Rhodococcus sp. AD45-ID]|uniref:PIN-like domain-containing protein n=1 Tax=Rhodococcus sp. AD45-ID TaxID=2127033 RepID=UPI0005D38112|nr:hypothetical protein SZ00_02637 [Rhodococcus sp. AD45]PSR39685.1 hypothetical protein C7T36_18590 [Rhodococcus sp. AD45-ID]